MAANYPDWVMAHKQKGTYINKVGDKYYLYAAHSERIKGTTKVRRVSDGYLGRITEKDGFIPAKSRIKSEPAVYEIGLSYCILAVSKNIHSGLRYSFRKYGDLIYSCAILFYIYGEYSSELFEHSYLHVCFPDVHFPASFTSAQITGIERGRRMISECLSRTFGDDLAKIRSFFPDIRLLRIENQYFLSHISDTVADLSKKYSIDWRNSLWQR